MMNHEILGANPIFRGTRRHQAVQWYRPARTLHCCLLGEFEVSDSNDLTKMPPPEWAQAHSSSGYTDGFLHLWTPMAGFAASTSASWRMVSSQQSHRDVARTKKENLCRAERNLPSVFSVLHLDGVRTHMVTNPELNIQPHGAKKG